MVEDAKEFFRQRALLDPIVKVKASLGTPADVERGVDMGFGPFHDFAELIPVIYLSEVQILYWSSSNDHAIITPVTDLVKGGIKRGKVVLVSVVR